MPLSRWNASDQVQPISRIMPIHDAAERARQSPNASGPLASAIRAHATSRTCRPPARCRWRDAGSRSPSGSASGRSKDAVTADAQWRAWRARADGIHGHRAVTRGRIRSRCSGRSFSQIAVARRIEGRLASTDPAPDLHRRALPTRRQPSRPGGHGVQAGARCGAKGRPSRRRMTTAPRRARLVARRARRHRTARVARRMLGWNALSAEFPLRAFDHAHCRSVAPSSSTSPAPTRSRSRTRSSPATSKSGSQPAPGNGARGSIRKAACAAVFALLRIDRAIFIALVTARWRGADARCARALRAAREGADSTC